MFIQIQILNGKQCRSRSDGFFRSQLIWIYTDCKDRACPGSAGYGLYYFLVELTRFQKGLGVQESKEEVTKNVSLVKWQKICKVYPVLLLTMNHDKVIIVSHYDITPIQIY